MSNHREKDTHTYINPFAIIAQHLVSIRTILERMENENKRLRVVQMQHVTKHTENEQMHNDDDEYIELSLMDLTNEYLRNK